MQVAPQFSACFAGVGPLSDSRDGSLYAATKRVIDVAVAATALTLLLPVLAACALLVVLDSPGPVFFRQQRVGKNGRLFTMLKFRSMRTGADTALHQQYVAAFIGGSLTTRGVERAASPAPGTTGGSPTAATPHTAGTTAGGLYKLTDDPRVTRVGRWLRRLSLDELPQLWNVLRGEMSLVGPRPPIAYELDHYAQAHMRRLLVVPGLTGLWQVSGRSRTTFEEMVALDLRYIEERSLALDLTILLKTIPVVLLGSDAG
jgi:lipopolysaccharide/colanic/teichoic acid biosynthesis glycosyltransferase